MPTADPNSLRFERRPIRVTPHDPTWAAGFQGELARLQEAIGRLACGGIHHIGSTAIPGVDAEPTIDILVGTSGEPACRECLDPLRALGYAPAAAAAEDAGDWRPLRKPAALEPAFALWLAPSDSRRFVEALAFRDILCTDLQIAIGYAGMKRDVAGRAGSDRARYEAAKVAMIEAILARS
jgi:GrpB-like predicted nucleotidyltransferase (UPF0157 family)